MTAASEMVATAGKAHKPPTPTEPKHVIVIDDDHVMLLSLRRILEKAGYTVETFSSGQAGLDRLKDTRPQILLVDLKMPELDGFQVIERVRALDQEIVIVVITGYATIGTAVDAMKAGAYDFLPKPCTPDELRLIVGRCCERWKLSQESKRLRREKEEAARRFVAFVSHQLRTPLGVVMQYLDVLLFKSRHGLSAEARHWITRSKERLHEMQAIIEDWLTLTRIESGALADTDGRADLAEIAAQVMRIAAPQAESAGITMTSEFQPNLPHVAGDPVALSTVVENLVVNAIKYNRPGGLVAVSAAREGDRVVAKVRDTGIGIPKSCIPNLFSDFYRVRSPETQDIPGTGLGLAICKRIVTELKGDISVESCAGKATTFVVRLPIAGTASAQSPMHEG